MITINNIKKIETTSPILLPYYIDEVVLHDGVFGNMYIFKLRAPDGSILQYHRGSNTFDIRWYRDSNELFFMGLKSVTTYTPAKEDFVSADAFCERAIVTVIRMAESYFNNR